MLGDWWSTLRGGLARGLSWGWQLHARVRAGAVGLWSRLIKAGRNQRNFDFVGRHFWVNLCAENNVGFGISGFGDDVGGFVDFQQAQILAAGDVEQHAFCAFNRDFEQRR